jgi:hypothetical protein
MNRASATLRPRRQVHRGTVQAAAFWFDPALLGEGEARRRVLAAWTPGATVLAVAEGYLLRLPQPRAVASDSVPGLPLTLDQGILSSAPLSASERKQLEGREGSVVLVRAGVAQVTPLSGGRAVELSEWLDVSGWVTLPVRGLGAPPPPVPVLEPVAPPTRELFGAGVPTLAPEAQVMLARMQGRPPPEGLVVPPRPGLLARLRAALRGAETEAGAGAASPGGLLQRLRAALGGKAADAAARPGVARGPGLLQRLFGASGASASGSAAPAGGPGLLARLAAWFQRNDSQPALPPGASGAATGPERTSVPVPRPPSRLSRWLAALFGGAGQGGGASAAPSPGNVRAAPQPPQGPPPGPGMLSRLSEWMLRNTPLGDLLGRRKAEYVRNLFDLFESGNLQEALRYAIPLGSHLDANTRVSLGLPGPRESITLQPGRSGGAASVFGGGEALFDALKERYRDAFRRLEREGRIDEAAFVLAELLGAHEEAVSFLERHGRFTLAAELAEGRNLPPGLVVRQWFLAKNVARATAIARRSGAFADAVLRLERTHPLEARSLRWAWGNALAEAGDWARAVQAVWPNPEARQQARAWMIWCADGGGVAGARMLALRATAFPEDLPTLEAPLRELLEDEAPERAPERFAFALTLSGEAPSTGRTALIVPTVRALLRDRAAGQARFDSSFLTRLLREAPDGTLRTDLPPLTERTHTPWKKDPSRQPLHALVQARDAGAFPIHDAVVLPDGRLLLALGEAGARLVRADGRTVAHFDVPAFSLVPSLHGDRALALAPRGEVRRLSRLDLRARKATGWCDTPLDAWASTYDGGTWFVATGNTVMMLDALAPEPRALWRVTDVRGPVWALAVDASRLSFLSADLERWTYDLPQGPTLRARAQLEKAERLLGGVVLSESLTADGEVAVMAEVRVPVGPLLETNGRVTQKHQREAWLSWLRPATPREVVPPESHRDDREAVILSEDWRVDVRRKGEYWRLYLSDVRGAARGLFVFDGPGGPRLRLTASALVAFDARGRLLVVDLEEGIPRWVAVP